ncbi:hypothetical protein J6590_027938 [Homalodisca vitripennis]|nr:hypothetical protein J6590_027938 [Homalodisca vitripennis]
MRLLQHRPRHRALSIAVQDRNINQRSVAVICTLVRYPSLCCMVVISWALCTTPDNNRSFLDTNRKTGHDKIEPLQTTNKTDNCYSGRKPRQSSIKHRGTRVARYNEATLACKVGTVHKVAARVRTTQNYIRSPHWEVRGTVGSARHGRVVSQHWSRVYARGVCVRASQNPTNNDSKFCGL